jgi:hypothetical protein
MSDAEPWTTDQLHSERMLAFATEHLVGGINFEARTEERAATVREKSKLVYGDTLLHCRLQLLAIAEILFARRSAVPGNATESSSDRLVLIAAFFQGITATEKLISEGQYVRAAAALKQELEVLARVGETIAGTAKPGRTPNVKYAPSGAGPIYGQLNDVAHPSTPQLLATLLDVFDDGGTHGVSYLPTFIGDRAVALYELHVWLLLEMVREMVRLQDDLYGTDEDLFACVAWWHLVATRMHNAGHISREAP